MKLNIHLNSIRTPVTIDWSLATGGEPDNLPKLLTAVIFLPNFLLRIHISVYKIHVAVYMKQNILPLNRHHFISDLFLV